VTDTDLIETARRLLARGRNEAEPPLSEQDYNCCFKLADKLSDISQNHPEAAEIGAALIALGHSRRAVGTGTTN